MKSKPPSLSVLSEPARRHRGTGNRVIPPGGWRGIRTSASCPSSHFCFRETPHNPPTPKPLIPPPPPPQYRMSWHVIPTSAATRDVVMDSLQVLQRPVTCPVCLRTASERTVHRSSARAAHDANSLVYVELQNHEPHPLCQQVEKTSR